MKATTTVRAMADAIGLARPATDKRLDITNCLMLRGATSGLSVEAGHFDVSILAPVAGATVEGAAAAVDAQMLASIIGAARADDEVALEIDYPAPPPERAGARVTGTPPPPVCRLAFGDGARYELAARPENEWGGGWTPATDAGSNPDIHSFRQPAGSLAAALATVKDVAREEDTRYYLRGTLLELSADGGARVLSTDGHRLHRSEMDVGPEHGAGDVKAIVPIVAAEAIAAATKRPPAETPVQWVLTCPSEVFWANFATCTVGGTVIRVSCIDGRFPDWRRVDAWEREAGSTSRSCRCGCRPRRIGPAPAAWKLPGFRGEGPGVAGARTRRRKGREGLRDLRAADPPDPDRGSTPSRHLRASVFGGSQDEQPGGGPPRLQRPPEGPARPAAGRCHQAGH